MPVSALMGKTTADVMPRSPSGSSVRALPGFRRVLRAFASSSNFIVSVFFLGDILMSARLILVGSSPSSIACAGRTGRPRRAINPRVAVLIPAYNEEKVIVRTIRSVLNSDYDNLHVIVIDDGSKRPHR